MKHILLSLLVALFAASCSDVPVPLSDGKGGAARFRQLGGKGSITYNADGSVMFVFDNEISMQHALQAATALGLSYIDYLGMKVMELTKQLANANLTTIEQAKISADLAKYNALLNAEKVKQGIGAGAPLGQVNFE